MKMFDLTKEKIKEEKDELLKYKGSWSNLWFDTKGKSYLGHTLFATEQEAQDRANYLTGRMLSGNLYLNFVNHPGVAMLAHQRVMSHVAPARPIWFARVMQIPVKGE